MKVCLIGNSLTTLSLGKNLVNKGIKVFNYSIKNKNKINTRTIGITRDNLQFFNKEILNIKKKMIWDIKKIDVYSEKYKKQKILNFENYKKSLFYILGTELDFSDGLNGKGFQFKNPNATRTCGCGESFSV